MNHHKLTTGTSQIERLIRALSPDSFQLDDRNWQDFITTAHRFAGWLTYYDELNSPAGDWAGFWEQETLTYLAVLAALDTDQIRRTYEEIEIDLAQAIEAFLDSDNDTCTEDPWPEYCLKLIVHIRSTARQIEKIYSKLKHLEHPLAAILLSLIERENNCDFEELQGALQKLVSYNKAADDELRDCEYNMFYGIERGLPDTKRWGIVGMAQYHLIPAKGKLPSQTELRELFKAFLQTLIVLKSRAQTDFSKELALVEKKDTEYVRPLQPHIALFLTFLNLFRHVQNDLNELPARHLRYYYEEVLGIARRPARPDHAYLIFTLAKGIDDEFIQKGTRLIGGKDKNGKPLYYETIEDWRVTQAKVEEVLNTYIGADYIKAEKVVENGAPLGETPFRLFGDDETNPAGEVGFAIASPQLLMKEGDRNLNIEIDLKGPVRNANDFSQGVFKVKYSTDAEGGFHEIFSLPGADANKTGFSIKPEVLTFLPLQKIEPARRAASDLMSDLYANSIGPVPSNSHYENLKKIFNGDFGLNSYLTDDLYYQALSGIYYVTIQIQDEEKRLNDTQLVLDESTQNEIRQALVELYFYRAYYHWSLATIFAPAYDPDDNAILEAGTLIPNLSNVLDIQIADLTTVPLFKLRELYQYIISDINGPNKSAEKYFLDITSPPRTRSKTVIDDHTISALLARVYFQQKNFSGCSVLCSQIINANVFRLEVDLNSIFNDPLESDEVIWAVEFTQDSDQRSAFPFLGYNNFSGEESDKHYFPLSEGLKNLYLKSQDLNSPPASPSFDDYLDNRVSELIRVNDSEPELYYSAKYFRGGAPHVVMVRLAEMYLMRAYCRTISTVVPLPETDINEITKDINFLRGIRSGVLEYNLIDEDTRGKLSELNSTSVTPAVLEEFLREMCFEGLRLSWLKVDDYKLTNRPATTPPVYVARDASTLLDKTQIEKTQRPSILKLNILLQKDAPPFVPSKKLSEANITPYPVLFISFLSNEKRSRLSKFYNFLIKQTIEKVTVISDVTGIQKNLISQTDFGVFDGTQRFYPFGPVPENGSKFYLGCEEAFYKKLDEATLNFTWIEDEFIDLDDIYQPVPSTGSSAGATYPGYKSFSFAPKIKVDILNEGRFDESLNEQVIGSNKYFNTLTDNARMRSHLLLENVTAERANTYDRLYKYEPTKKRGFARVTLQGDFGHKIYPNILTAETIRMTSNPSTADPDKLPKPPYSPSTNTISLDYSSEQDMVWETYENGVKTGGIDQFFHLLPFEGFRKFEFGQKDNKGESIVPSLVYDFDLPPALPKDDDLEESAAPPQAQSGGDFFPAVLYIGLSQLDPGGALSLLFQAAEGSELMPDDEAPVIRWSYLRKNNDWEAFPPQNILGDSTMGLTKSGIIQLAIPLDISSEGNTMLNAALLWVRASMLETAGRVANALPGFTAVNAQAIEVQFTDQNNELTHLSKPQPEGSISKLEFSRSVVKTIEQPLPSFDGRLPEDIGTEYFRRVSERLRNKDRAVTPQDYERILLERYGDLLTAKAIPHTQYEKRTELNAPGYISVAVIPNLRIQPKERRVTPRIPTGQLLKMEEFLRTKTNLHTQQIQPVKRLQVLNPRYDRLTVLVKIKFKDGDFNLFKTRTREALDHFIAPWINDTDQYPVFGRCIYRSQIIALLENLPFVLYVKELNIYVENTAGKYEASNGYVIEPASSRSILTTGLGHIIVPPDPGPELKEGKVPDFIVPVNQSPGLSPDSSLLDDEEEPESETGDVSAATIERAVLENIVSDAPAAELEKVVLTQEEKIAEIAPKKRGRAKKTPVVAEAENDLTLIEGIGPKVQEALKSAGIKSWAVLAKTPVDGLKDLLKKEGPRFALQDPTTWPEQAALAAAGKMDELSQLKTMLRGGKH